MQKTSVTTANNRSDKISQADKGGGKRSVEPEVDNSFESSLEAGERERHFVSINGKPLDVPVMTVDEFCRKYHLSENIRQHLEDEEFKTAGAVLEVSETTLQAAGFKSGQIADLKKALKEFLITNVPPVPT
ncbi:hypothetical protein B0H12DRAFT_1168630 [Mycena haematopus]|nr:hypothetical protein B0H12DRAFT_1168630 [Mycena haematopus]